MIRRSGDDLAVSRHLMPPLLDDGEAFPEYPILFHMVNYLMPQGSTPSASDCPTYRNSRRLVMKKQIGSVNEGRGTFGVNPADLAKSVLPLALLALWANPS